MCDLTLTMVISCTNQAFNSVFHDQLESIQYNTCLAITGAIRGTSREKLYQELGLESLQLIRWCRKLCLFYDIIKNQNPQHFFNQTIARHWLYTTRNVSKPFFNPRHSFFKNSFFPSTIIKWNKSDIKPQYSRSLFIFKKPIL